MVTLRQTLGLTAICVVALVSIPLVSAANTIHVQPGEQVEPALTSASAGDTVMVHCGTYEVQGLQMVSGVTLRSESGDPACVRFESSGGEPILACDTLAGISRIEGITFTAVSGGMATPVARGAGMHIYRSGPQVMDCVFIGLEADYGGAVYCNDGAAGVSPMFYRCSFLGNSARAVGGAMNCVNESRPTLVACLFADNEAVTGGHAINAALSAAPQIVTSTLADNGALHGSTLLAFDGGTMSVSNSIITNGSQSLAWSGDFSAAPAIQCSDLFALDQDAWPGLMASMSGIDGNFSADPLFCGDLGGGQPYTLDEISPCAPAHSNCGSMGAFPVACTNSTVTGVPETPAHQLPQVSQLRGNYPNPFNPSTTIRYDVQHAGTVDIAIYDVAGRLIKQIVANNMTAGSHQVQWHGTDQADRPVSAGVYFVQLKTGIARDTQSVSLIK